MLLNININYLASLRNSIGGGEPDILKFARYCEHSGADSISMHINKGVSPISTYDVKYLRQHLKSRFILKMPMEEEFKQLAFDCKPDLVCIVPICEELSPSNGVNAIKSQHEITEFLAPLEKNGILTSVFINPDIDQINAVYKAGLHYVELNARKFSEAYNFGTFDEEFTKLKEGSVLASSLGMSVSLCKGINYQNAAKLAEIHGVKEMTIGHSITAKAIFSGLDNSIKEMKELINEK